MDIKYNVIKLKNNKEEEIKDHISVEEPLEMSLRYKKDGDWQSRTHHLSPRYTTKWNELPRAS